MGSSFHELLHPVPVRDKDMKGWAVAIDGTAWLHQLLKVTARTFPGQRLELVDGSCRVINHLRGFLYRAVHLLSRDIWPVFVFDGAGTGKDRNQVSKATLHGDFDTLRRLHAEAIARNMRPLARSIATSAGFAYPLAEAESKRLLSLLGMPVITAPGEGEAQCTWFQRRGIVDAVVTPDADALLHGAKVVIDSLAVTRAESSKIVLDAELDHLGITLAQLVDLAILCGTDYHPGIPGIGPRTALRLLVRHGGIEDIALAMPGRYEWGLLGIRKPRLVPRSDLLDELRARFTSPVVSESIGSVSWATPDVAGTRAMLCDDHTLSPALVDKALGTLRRAVA